MNRGECGGLAVSGLAAGFSMNAKRLHLLMAA